MAEPDDELVTVDEEQISVYANVAQHLVRLGFDGLTAQVLAEAGIDWRKAKELLGAGCDHETAARILI